MFEEKICPYINAPCISDKCEAYSSKLYKHVEVYSRMLPVYLPYNEVEEEKSVEQKYWFGLRKKTVKQKIKRKLTESERLVNNIKKYEIVARICIYHTFCEKISNIEHKKIYDVESYHTFTEIDEDNVYRQLYWLHYLWDFKSCDKDIQEKILSLYDESAQKYLGLI